MNESNMKICPQNETCFLALRAELAVSNHYLVRGLDYIMTLDGFTLQLQE